MFNIGFAELLLILIIAYVIVGPKDLPRVARWLARVVRYARQLIRELRKESGWDDLMAETADVRREVGGALKEADISAELKDARQSLQKSVSEAEKEAMKNSGNGSA